MLTEQRRQYQALEPTFCWTLEESACGTSKICGKQKKLIPLSQIGGNKKTLGPPAQREGRFLEELPSIANTLW
jgi:hypothetical protein